MSSPSCCRRTSSSPRPRSCIAACSRLAPDHPRALHYAGVLAHQQGRQRRSRRADRAEPRAGARSGGLVAAIWASSSSRTAGSTRRSRHIGVRSPSTRATRTPTAISACCCGRPGSRSDAEAAYRTAIRLNPEHIDAYTNLGILLNGLKRTEEAAACYCKVITLRPKHREARKLLALAHCTLGRDRQRR